MRWANIRRKTMHVRMYRNIPNVTNGCAVSVPPSRPARVRAHVSAFVACACVRMLVCVCVCVCRLHVRIQHSWGSHHSSEACASAMYTKAKWTRWPNSMASVDRSCAHLRNGGQVYDAPTISTGRSGWPRAAASIESHNVDRAPSIVASSTSGALSPTRRVPAKHRLCRT